MFRTLTHVTHAHACIRVPLQLLSVHNQAIVSEAWQLVKSLPTNPRIRAKVHKLGEPNQVGPLPAMRVLRTDCALVTRHPRHPRLLRTRQKATTGSSLLDATSVHRLLYTLQIVDGLARVPAHPSASDAGSGGDSGGGVGGDESVAGERAQEAATWSRGFVANGWVPRLADALVTLTSSAARRDQLHHVRTWWLMIAWLCGDTCLGYTLSRVCDRGCDCGCLWVWGTRVSEVLSLARAPYARTRLALVCSCVDDNAAGSTGVRGSVAAPVGPLWHHRACRHGASGGCGRRGVGRARPQRGGGSGD